MPNLTAAKYDEYLEKVQAEHDAKQKKIDDAKRKYGPGVYVGADGKVHPSGKPVSKQIADGVTNLGKRTREIAEDIFYLGRDIRKDPAYQAGVLSYDPVDEASATSYGAEMRRAEEAMRKKPKKGGSIRRGRRSNSRRSKSKKSKKSKRTRRGKTRR